MTIAERQLNRRQALLGAGLVGGGALAALITAPAVAAKENGATGLEGAWHVYVVPDDGSASHQVLILYAIGGGVAAISDNPPSTDSTGFGAWQRTGDNQFLNTFELFTFNASGQSAGILRIRALSTLDKTGNHMSGRAHIDIQQAGTFVTVQATHFTGNRIHALPL
jgi:hypothetical protein